MAESAVIQEFLVALEGDVGEKGLKKFRDGVEQTMKSVLQMVNTLQDATVTISGAVTAFASKLEGLYFVSQRTGASVAGLKAVEFSAKNLGISAEKAQGSVESLARFMRTNPVGESYIKNLGIQTRDANGALRDTVDIMADLGGALAKKPVAAASKDANAIGIDESLLPAMRGGEFTNYLSQYRDLTSQAGFDNAAEDSHKFMVGVRNLGAVWDGFSAELFGSLVERLGPKLAEFLEWFQTNGPLIEQRVVDIAVAVVAAAEAIGPVLGYAIDLFLDLDKSTDGWSTKIAAAVLIFRALGGVQLVGGIWTMANALRALGGAAALTGAGTGAGGVAAGGGIAAGIAGMLSRFASFARIGGALSLLFHSEGLNKGEPEYLAAQRKGKMVISNPDGTTSLVTPPPYVPPGTEPLSKEARAKANAFLRGPRNPGRGPFVKSQGAVSGDSDSPVVFPGDAYWPQSRGEQLRSHARRGLDTVRGAMSGRAPWSESAFGASVSDFAKRFGAGEDPMLDLSNLKGLPGFASAITRQENGRNPFATSTILGAGSGEQRQINMTQTNSTTVHVTGVSDPAAAGRAVRDEQEDLNRELTRNMQGALS